MLGAEVIAMPAIEIRVVEDLSPLDRALRQLEVYAWLVFTSANGVRITWQRAESLGVGADSLASLHIAAIGPATAAAVRARGAEATFTPTEFIAERLAAEMEPVRGKRILLPRAEGARSVLPTELRLRGAFVDEIPIYRAVAAQIDGTTIQELSRGVNVITFTSPSTVRGFIQIVDSAGLDPHRLPGSPLIACIGPVTAAAATEVGLPPGLTAGRYTADGLAQALAEHFTEKRPHGLTSR